ncbi:hypothetical protein B0H14DRAFT_2564611 [Mycena olivaceomarginata]|nr:hypothetical protein B0H14DRAFT_2564611 [Mycena olivaceomarginata]
MQTTVELDDFDFDFSDAQFTKDTRATRDAQEIVTQASNNGFYSIPAVLLPNLCNSFEHMTRIGDEDQRNSLPLSNYPRHMSVTRWFSAFLGVDVSFGPASVLGGSSLRCFSLSSPIRLDSKA